VAGVDSSHFLRVEGRVMKKLAFLGLVVLVAIAAVLSSCGSNQIQELPSSSINGYWEAQLTGGIQGASALNFVVQFNLFVTNGSPAQNVNVTAFSWINSNPCFPQVPSVTGTTKLTNNINLQKVTGSITFTIGKAPGNVLTLSADPDATPPTGELIGTAPANNGSVTNGGVNGMWWLTPGTSFPSGLEACSAGGETSPRPFIMCQGATSCTTALGPS
jgi:hypothetical protein